VIERERETEREKMVMSYFYMHGMYSCTQLHLIRLMVAVILQHCMSMCIARRILWLYSCMLQGGTDRIRIYWSLISCLLVLVGSWLQGACCTIMGCTYFSSRDGGGAVLHV
jgi:hypothetical protein